MFTAILWDYDGTLANTPVKNIAVTRAVLGRLDPALRAMGRAAEVVCVAAAWGGAPSVDLAAADAVAVRPADLPDLLADL